MRRAILLALLVAAEVAAQQPGVIVRGTLRGDGDFGLPYGIVSIEPGGSERFTDLTGAFHFTGIAPGTAHVRARRLGYRPVDTLVNVSADMAPLTLRMERLAVTLETVRVTARKPCVRGGAPDAASAPELAAIFEQLRENARRYRLVAARYPFAYRAERRFEEPGLYSAQQQGVDTIVMASSSDWTYKPGQVVTDIVVAGRRERQMNLPGLPQFADDAFIAAHCFSYAGISTEHGRPLVQVDFQPKRNLRHPDIEGSVFLDPERDYVIQRLVVSLTQPRRVVYGLEGIDVTTVYRETKPPIVVLDTVVAVRRTALGERRHQRIERQTLIDFFFQRGAGPP